MSEEKKMFDLKVFDFGAAAHVPLIEENLLINQRSPWVYYGPANLAPQELIRLYNSSPTHRACVTSKWYAARGEEITLKSGENLRLQMVNSAGDKMYDLWSKLMLDFILYGGFALNIVWRKDRTKGFEMYYVDFSKLRAEKSDMHDRIENYYYSADWAYPKKYPFVPRKIPAFNPAHEEPSQIFYYRNHAVGQMYYPTPSYWGGATAISTQIEIFNWHYNNIVNGLAPNLFISLNTGVPSPEQREMIYNQLNSKYGGSNQAGKLFLTFADSKEQAPEITAINSNSSDKMWIELNQMVQETILTCHQVSSPELLGIQVPGALGSSEHLEAQDHFQHLVIAPIQTEVKTVMEKLISLRDNGTPTEIDIKQFEMVTIPDTKPIETVDVNKTEDVGVQKDETITEQ
jgi:hypothetical protein